MAALIAGALAAAPVHAQATFKRGFLTITQGKVRAFLNVEVADTEESRAQGLGNRTSLADDAGMLFVFQTNSLWAFWMKDTLIPLSLAFIDEQWTIVDLIDMPVAKDSKYGPFEIYKAAKPARYALEVNQGYFKRKNLSIGAQVVYTPK